MWTRSAFWIGAPKAGFEAPFKVGVTDVLVPGLTSLPGVKGVTALWPDRCEQGAPQIACQILVQFASMADIDLMLSSQQRQALRLEVVKLAEMFDGTISHIDYHVG